MADTNIPLWQSMEQEASHELFAMKDHDFSFSRAVSISHFKVDLLSFEFHQPKVRDRNPVRVLPYEYLITCSGPLNGSLPYTTQSFWADFTRTS